MGDHLCLVVFTLCALVSFSGHFGGKESRQLFKVILNILNHFILEQVVATLVKVL
jgi:hypothetical protein